MATGYEVSMYRDIHMIAVSLEKISTTLELIQATLEEDVPTKEAVLIAGLMPSVLPLDIGLRQRLLAATEVVQSFLEEEKP